MANKRSHLLKNFFFVSSLTILGAGLGVFVLASYFVQDLPSPEQISTHRAAQSTKIFDRTGTTLLYEVFGEEKRTIIPLPQIPEYIKQATVASEDDRFYENPGFSWRSIIRAFLTDLLHGEFAQGGSTITQQLAKNAFLSPEKTITRKVKELILAIRLERQYPKEEILGMYLNEIPYGSNTYGIEAAARTYFEKSAKDLTLAESALLVAVAKAPSYYSPYGVHTDELAKRKDGVLDRMAELGMITEKERDAAKKQKINLAERVTSIKAPHFVMAVQDYLIGKYGEDFLRTNGLRVITTLDYPLQQLAEKVVKEGSDRNFQLYKGRNAALVSQDANTGQILAMVGSHDYFDVESEGNFNVATQGLRQPGSSFKPFAYVAAFKKGYAPETVLFDVPTEFDTTGLKSFKPENFDHEFKGPVTLRAALAQSMNIPAVKVLYLAGIENTLSTARDFGITTLTDSNRYGLSLVLGSGEVKPVEMAGAYSVFAQDGKKHTQTMILSIEDSTGNKLEEYRDEVTQVIDPQYTRLITDILSDADARSPLYQNSLYLTLFPDHQVAMKTGTTSNYVDAWTIGYTPSLVTVVWVGNNRNEPMQQQGSSILAALPIFSQFMREALKDRPSEAFIKPEPVISSKPILRGEYDVDRQIHTILYYVDKNNPQGPLPTNPEKDPQFKNWEEGVLAWAAQHIPQFSTYNTDLFDLSRYTSFITGPLAKIEIAIASPRNGDFIKSNPSNPSQASLHVQAQINSTQAISKIETFFNNQIIDQRNTFFGSQYFYAFSTTVQNTQLQNKLTIRVTDASGATKEQSIILFK